MRGGYDAFSAEIVFTFFLPDAGSFLFQSGNAALGAGILDSPDAGVYLVVMDDFIYGEPQANGVPEPGSLLLTAAGAAMVFPVRR